MWKVEASVLNCKRSSLLWWVVVLIRNVIARQKGSIIQDKERNQAAQICYPEAHPQ